MTDPRDLLVELRRPYAPFVRGAIVGLVLAAITGTIAATNDRPLLIEYSIRLSAEDATTFWEVIAAVMVAVALANVVAVVRLATRRSYRLVATADGISLPERRWWKLGSDVVVPWRELAAVFLGYHQRKLQLMLRSARGTYMLPARAIPPELGSQRVVTLLTERWQGMNQRA